MNMFIRAILTTLVTLTLFLALTSPAHAGLIRQEWLEEFSGFDLKTQKDTASIKIYAPIGLTGVLENIHISGDKDSGWQYLQPRSMSCDPETATCLYLFDAERPAVGSLPGKIEFAVIVKHGAVSTVSQTTWEMDSYDNLAPSLNLLGFVLFNPVPKKQSTD